jgi:hypothetical protein
MMGVVGVHVERKESGGSIHVSRAQVMIDIIMAFSIYLSSSSIN